MFSNKKKLLNLATLIMINVGVSSGWPSPTLPILQSGRHTFNVTETDAYWISKALQSGVFFGAPLASFIIDVIGRKNTILFATVPYSVSWLLIAYGNSIAVFLFARFLSGISEGCVYIALPMYIGEIADKSIRGVLGSLISITVSLGGLLINFIGPIYSIPTTALISLLFPLLCFATFVFMPESPYFLLMRKKELEAGKSLRFLKNTKQVDKDLSTIKNDVSRMMSEAGTFKDLFCIRSNRKALFIMMSLRFAQQMSGITVFSNHIKIILELTDSTNSRTSLMTTDNAAVLYNVIQVTVITSMIAIVDRFKRKHLLITSLSITGLNLLLQSVYFYGRDTNLFDVQSVRWIPLVLMLVYNVFDFALYMLPNVILSELFSSSIKPKALCLMHMYFSFVFMISMEIFQQFKSCLYVMFLIFAVFCFLNSFIIYKFAPETKGKSLEEIQQILKNNRSRITSHL